MTTQEASCCHSRLRIDERDNTIRCHTCNLQLTSDELLHMLDRAPPIEPPADAWRRGWKEAVLYCRQRCCDVAEKRDRQGLREEALGIELAAARLDATPPPYEAPVAKDVGTAAAAYNPDAGPGAHEAGTSSAAEARTKAGVIDLVRSTIIPRPGDPPPFEVDGNRRIVRLREYTIVPLEYLDADALVKAEQRAARAHLAVGWTEAPLDERGEVPPAERHHEPDRVVALAHVLRRQEGLDARRPRGHQARPRQGALPMTKDSRDALPHPMQPVGLDNKNRPRFKENKIVRHMLDLLTDRGLFDLNQVARMVGNGSFSEEDQIQLAQLIGYSVGGFGELPYVPDDVFEKAEEAAQKALGGKKS